MPLRLSEAQQLYDGLSDPLLKPALELFFEQRKGFAIDSLLSAVRQNVRDTMKEARLAGQVEVYENCIKDLQRFAEEQLRSATQ